MSKKNIRVNCVDIFTGEQKVLVYDLLNSKLTYEDGAPVIEVDSPEKKLSYPKCEKTNYGERNVKNHNVRFLRIILGTKCNYSCAYCSQAYNEPDEIVSTIDTVDTFLEKLDGWLTGEPKRIELWGGEPLVYIKYLKRLVPKLREKFPNAQISTITNGSLLTDDVVDFFVKYRVVFSVSHDGIGQAIRGKEILDDPKKVEVIRRANRLMRKPDGTTTFTFNTTFNKLCIDPIENKRFFAKIFGEDINVSSDPILAVGKAEIDGKVIPNDEELKKFAVNVATATMLYEQLSSYSLFRYAKIFEEAIRNEWPLSELGQKCDQDRDSSLVVDLQGNVYTCQNFVKRNDIKGNVSDFDNINIRDIQHYSFRKSCMSCPFALMCKGGCPAIQGNAFAETCKIKFAFFSGLFVSAILKMTKTLMPRSIDCEFEKPVKELIETKHGKFEKVTHIDLPDFDYPTLNKYAGVRSHTEV